MIRPTALIDASVNVPSDCVIGAFSVIKRGVRLGRRVRIGEYAVIKSGTVHILDVKLDGVDFKCRSVIERAFVGQKKGFGGDVCVSLKRARWLTLDGSFSRST